MRVRGRKRTSKYARSFVTLCDYGSEELNSLGLDELEGQKAHATGSLAWLLCYAGAAETKRATHRRLEAMRVYWEAEMKERRERGGG